MIGKKTALAPCPGQTPAVYIDTGDMEMKLTTALVLLTLLFVISFFLPQTWLAWGVFTSVVVVCGLVMFFQPLEREKKRHRR